MKCDAHLHMFDLAQRDPFCWEEFLRLNRPGMISHYSREEHDYYLDKRKAGISMLLSLGIHPQEPLWIHAEVLLDALATKSIQAVGECGYDFFHTRTPEEEKIQDEIFLFQVDLARKFQLPLILHLRKATDKIFQHLKVLKKVPTVVFHSWPSPYAEAKSLLKSGLNAYFSFGNPLRQGNKKAINCLVNLPMDRILMETDAPWQTLKGESFTPLGALDLNYRAASEFRGIFLEDWESKVADNFSKAYGVDGIR